MYRFQFITITKRKHKCKTTYWKEYWEWELPHGGIRSIEPENYIGGYIDRISSRFNAWTRVPIEFDMREIKVRK